MKQSLLILILFLFGLNIIHAQKKKPYEETTWNVIRERLFNGKNSHAFRFEENIRFQLVGETSKNDSTLVENIIGELNSLIETIEIELVEEEGNFIIEILPQESTIRQKTNFHRDGNKITYTRLWFSFNETSSPEKNKKEIYYYIVRHLTRIFEPQNGKTFYGGIFDSSFPRVVNFNEIDKDLIRKLYSKDFYKRLRQNTVEKYSYLYYVNLRYHYRLKYISILLGILFLVSGLFFSKSWQTKNEYLGTFWQYLKNRLIVLLSISTAYPFFTLPENLRMAIDVGFLQYFFSLVVIIFVISILVVTLLFVIEKYFLHKITNIIQKQIFIFITTILSVLLVCFLILILLKRGQFYSLPIEFTVPVISFTIIIASLRVFLNFLNYRLQSMVNQKDVELAKMKELKNQAELNALHSRINPHFLYNSLNSIASLAHINPDKTENMATALSELFRYSINKEDKTYVRVEEELEMVEKYLEIEKTRFGERLNYEVKVDESVKEKLIPKFLIQPLAENAIKHGLSKIKGVGKIIIEVKQVEKDMVITIFDNGPDFPAEPVSGYGLQNLHDKLQIIYGDEAFINWENGENKHFQITIKNQF